MSPPTKPGRRYVDVYEAVKYDVRLHGARFIAIEFGVVGLIALGIVVAKLVQGDFSTAGIEAIIFFAGFALNCLAVVLLVRRAARLGTRTNVVERRLHLFAAGLVVLLLVPGAVALLEVVQRSETNAQDDG
jgi:hypothetical protein